MANIEGNYDVNAEPSSSIDVLPAGEYTASIIESKIEDISKKRDVGGCLVLVWKVDSGEFTGRLLWQRLNLFANEDMDNYKKVVEINDSKFAQVRHSCSKIIVSDSTELHHIPCIIRVVIEIDPTGKYQPRNEIKGVKALAASKVSNIMDRAPTTAASGSSKPSFMTRRDQS